MSHTPTSSPVRIGRRFANSCFTPVDGASLAVFRFVTGGILLWEVARYFDHGWIGRYWIAPVFHFTYYGFGWVRPWPGDGMHLHMFVLGLVSLTLAVGLMYRASAVLLFLGFAYIFLLDQARYLNHFYLLTLVTFLMIFLPAHRSFSLDARLRPGLRSGTVPAWTVGIVRFQIAVAYFYAGLAKLNPDWLTGAPMRKMLESRTDFPLFGPWLDTYATVVFFTYGGLLFDLLVVALLLWRRTRRAAFVASIFFHLTNAWLFDLGIFPWFMLAATLIFFPPDWPRRALNFLAPELRAKATAARAQGGRAGEASPIQPRQVVVMTLLGLYVAFQLLFPLRHYLYPGDVSWTEEGHRFSWHMKLRVKRGRGSFRITEPVHGTSWTLHPDEFLTSWQTSKMLRRPDMALQFAHFLAEKYREEGLENVEVRADIQVSLNGRPYQALIDPSVDLASQERNLWPADWILPLTTPLEPHGSRE